MSKEKVRIRHRRHGILNPEDHMGWNNFLAKHKEFLIVCFVWNPIISSTCSWKKGWWIAAWNSKSADYWFHFGNHFDQDFNSSFSFYWKIRGLSADSEQKLIKTGQTWLTHIKFFLDFDTPLFLCISFQKR